MPFQRFPAFARPAARAVLLAMLPAAAGALAGPSPTATGPIRQLVGEAYAPGDGRLMYREFHWLFTGPRGPSRLVLYRCPDGHAFARKWLYDDGDPQAPDFTLVDGRTGYREGVRRRGGGREVFVDDKGRERHAGLAPADTLVVDAGFDAFVRDHWDALGRGDGQEVSFVVPGRLDTLRFTVRRGEDATVAGRPARQFRLGLASWIGFALPHIDVAYDARTRALLRFAGLTNIRGDRGDNVRARITFDPGRERAATPAEFTAAADAPLDGRCPIP